MNFDISFGYTIKSDDETSHEFRKNVKKIQQSEIKSKITELINTVPENAEHVYLYVEKTYEEKLGIALSQI